MIFGWMQCRAFRNSCFANVFRECVENANGKICVDFLVFRVDSVHYCSRSGYALIFGILTRATAHNKLFFCSHLFCGCISLIFSASHRNPNVEKRRKKNNIEMKFYWFGFKCEWIRITKSNLKLQFRCLRFKTQIKGILVVTFPKLFSGVVIVVFFFSFSYACARFSKLNWNQQRKLNAARKKKKKTRCHRHNYTVEIQGVHTVAQRAVEQIRTHEKKNISTHSCERPRVYVRVERKRSRKMIEKSAYFAQHNCPDHIRFLRRRLHHHHY